MSENIHPVERLWREVGLPEYFLGNGGSNHKLYALYDAIRASAVETRAAEDELRAHWSDFCDADPFPNSDTFADRMEALGYLEVVRVTKAALQESFAAERGLEPGGLMYRLTPAGRDVVSKRDPIAKAERTTP